MHVLELLGSTLGLAFVAGIRLYATVLAVGLALHFRLLHLPPNLEALSILGHPAVLGAAMLAYTAEFLADKIPWIDTLWDAFHLLIRPMGAALLSLAAVATLDPVAQIVIILLCGGLALSAHSLKAAIRLIVNHSPEPFSNIAVSLAEDVFAIGMIWLALVHPVVTLGMLSFAVAGVLLVAPRLWRLCRVEILGIVGVVSRWFGVVGATIRSRGWDTLPIDLEHRFRLDAGSGAFPVARGAVGRGIGLPRNSVGVLLLVEESVIFSARVWFRRREWAQPLNRLRSVALHRRLLFDRLALQFASGDIVIHVFKSPRDTGARMVAALKAGMTTSAVTMFGRRGGP